MAWKPLITGVQYWTELLILREKVIEAIQFEVAKKRPDEILDLVVIDRRDRSLEHVFTLLSLLLEREPLRAAFQALHHEDVRHRGTALEYLATVLPIEVRDAVWPFLGDTTPLPRAPGAKEVLADLVRAGDV